MRLFTKKIIIIITNILIIVNFLYLNFREVTSNVPDTQLQENGIIVKLENSAVSIAQDSVDDEGIITIPDPAWNTLVTHVDVPGQKWVDTLFLDVSDLDIAVSPEQEPNLQDKDIDITTNGTRIVECDHGYDGLGVVTIETAVPSDVYNQNKTVDITTNGEQQINADSGYSGLGTVSINTNVQPSLESVDTRITSNTPLPLIIEPSDHYDGLSSVIVRGQRQVIDNVTLTQNGEFNFTCGDNFVGISEINGTVEVPSDVHNQNKEVNINSNTTTTVSADSGYSGLSSVTINTNIQPNLTTRTYEFEKNNQNPVTLIKPSGYDGYSSVTIDAPLQDKTNLVISENGTFSYECDSSYYGLKTVSGTVNVPIPQPNLRPLSVMLKKDSTSGTHTYTPDQGYAGFSNVEVTASLESPTTTITTNGTTVLEPSNSNVFGLKKATIVVNVPTSVPKYNFFSISTSPNANNKFTLDQSQFTYVGSTAQSISVAASKMLISFKKQSTFSDVIKFTFEFSKPTSSCSVSLYDSYYYILNYGYTNTPFLLYGYDENNNVLSVNYPELRTSGGTEHYESYFFVLKSQLPTWIANL